jgi:ribosome modulation factor
MLERDMQFSEYPLLNTPHLTLIIMKASAEPGATLDGAVERLKKALHKAREDSPVNKVALRRHLEEVAGQLTGLGLLSADGRLRITRRGREALAKYPKGFDFADIADPIRSGAPNSRESSTIADPWGQAFEHGYDAYRRGGSLSDNPYPQDSANHLVWEDGWSEARDDAERPYASEISSPAGDGK